MNQALIAINACQDQFQAPTVHAALALLTSKQRVFVLGIMVSGLSNSAAAREAGFASGNHASVLMKNPNVVNAIAAMQLEYASKLEMDVENVKEGMLDAIDVARATNNAMAMIAGWREIGKLIGVYVEPEKNININVNDMDSLENVSTERLYELMGKNVLEVFEITEEKDGI
jgi:phage terminase small subunit